MWDVQKAVQYLNQHAEPSSKGYCARYVKKAISAGGDISDWPSIVSAKDYGSALLARGFQVISGQNDFIAGDVVIIQGFNKSDFPAGEIKKDHPHGHMAMFNGQQWVSDFKQNNGYYPGGDYRKAKPGFVFYRHKDVGSHSSETKAVSGYHPMKICFPVRKENGQDYATLDEMMQLVNGEPHGTWLAGTNLLWHGGIHLSESSAKWSILEPGKADAAVPVQCMVGGDVVAWRVNQDYLTNVYADHTLQYSSTFVLVKSTCQPDPENEKSWLDFYTLYMGLAPLSAFDKHKCMKVKAEGGIRRHPQGRYEGSPSSPDESTMTTSYKGTWKKGTRVLVLKEQTFTYRHKENQVFGLAQEIDARGVVKGKSYWVSTSTDFMEPDGEEYAYLPDWMKQAVEQGGFDSVVKPSSPLSIAAGDAIGFLGKDTDSTGAADAETSHFVHIEVLSADPRMPDFLNNTAQVKTGRKYIRLHEDGKLYTRSGDTFTENSGELGKDIHRVLPEDQCNPFTDAEKKRWFQVSPQSWMSQDGVDELPQYSLKELGFTALEQSATSDMAASLCEDWAKQALGEIAKQIVPARGLQEKQVADYYQKAMKRVDTDGNGKLSAQELLAAFTHPEMGVCDIVARMVVKHDSEWFGNSSDPKWTAYYKDYDKPLLNYSKKWQDDMSWMESVEPFSKGKPVWHMHPVMFLDAIGDEDGMSLKWLKVEKGQLTFDAEGNDQNSSPWFSRKVHWPAGVSGITIGRGYDLGQQTTSESDLTQVGIVDPLKTWLVGSQGLSASGAHARLNSAPEDIRSANISRKQQHDLFALIYQRLEADVKRICQKNSTIHAYHPNPQVTPDQAWEGIPEKIKEVLVDLRYRGDYTSHARSILQHYAYSGNLDGFGQVLSNRNNWQNVPADRFNRRVRFYES